MVTILLTLIELAQPFICELKFIQLPSSIVEFELKLEISTKG
jgi:hypothetical protein